MEIRKAGYRLNKSERLKEKKVFEELFKNGKSLKAYPLRLVWLERVLPADSPPLKFGIAVPKRKFSKATQRNRIKRLIREAYRLNKKVLWNTAKKNERQLFILIIYTGKEEFSLKDIVSALKKILKKLNQKIKHTANQKQSSGLL